MRKKVDPNKPRPWWEVGMRVRRMTSDELGTIVEVSGKIKVKWDNGQTSYDLRSERSNVKLKLENPKR